jgi:caffeoyl-CoA O-methyltransferase
MIIYNDTLSNYITELYAPEDEALRAAREESPKKGLPAIGIKPEEGRFLQLLARASGGRRALEIGTLGGYSGIWIARGLAPGGKLITLEKEPKHAEVARAHFAAAGVAGRVEIRVGEARDSLAGLTHHEPFDFVFIDADKTGYGAYFDWALEGVRVGGLIVAHNAFRNGEIINAGSTQADTIYMRSFNKRLAGEPRVISTIYPGGDGTLVAIKIE